MIRALLLAAVLALVTALPGPATAAPPEPGTQCSTGKWNHVQCIRPSYFVHDTCQALEFFARENDLDPGFFTRLIWQESRFDPNAVSPADARGIARVIESTALQRGLQASHNPAEALEHSAHYLGEMTRRYGNQGLAAVGYNGGERRAEGLIAGTAGLAQETVDYVQIITGLWAEDWRDEPPEDHDFRLQGDVPFQEACRDLARNRTLTAYPPLTPPYKPYGVQVAFGTSESRARSQAHSRTASCRSQTEGVQLDIIRVRNRVSGRKPYYMARYGRDSAQAAHRLCSALRSAGCICAVYKND